MNRSATATAAELMLRELEELERKRTTLANYRQILKCRLLPRFGEIPVGRTRRNQVEALATDGTPRLPDDADLRRLRTRR